MAPLSFLLVCALVARGRGAQLRSTFTRRAAAARDDAALATAHPESTEVSLAVVRSGAGGDHHARPRVLLMDSCSGSMFVQTTARRLLDLHGFTGADSGYEISRTQHDPQYRKHPSDGLGTAMKRMVKKAAKRGRTLTFKASPMTYRTNEGMVSNLMMLNAYHVHVWRNVLDEAICMVRDCSKDQLGYPVDKSGKRSEMCFERRKDNSTADEYKARMTVSRVPSWINETLMRHRQFPETLAQMYGISNVTSIMLEDLTAFEWAPEDAAMRTAGRAYWCHDVACSVRAWCKLLKAWGVKRPDTHVVLQYLREHGLGSRGPPGSHTTVIENAAEVKAALQAFSPDVASLFRD
mmetsp:Transcript_110962/g.312844  ORF Transcript_110962/g.312844 Transcript_110962/m.312844 type:complete len:350 (+) Transcript_110962:84-1133(+)